MIGPRVSIRGRSRSPPEERALRLGPTWRTPGPCPSTPPRLLLSVRPRVRRRKGLGVLARCAPHHFAGGVVGHQGDVAVVLAPRHLVDDDIEQAVQTARVELIGDNPGSDPPDGLPVDADQPGDRRLVGLGRQERHQRLEIGRDEARAGPSERHRLHPDPVRRACQSAQMSPNLETPHAEVEVSPARDVGPAELVGGTGAVCAIGAGQSPSRKSHSHHHHGRRELHRGDPDASEAQETLEYCGDAHG